MALLLRIVAGRRQCHQPAQAQVGQRQQRLGECRQRSEFDARLAGFAAHIELQTDIDGTQFGRALFGKPARDLLAIDAMHPAEMLGHVAGLVGLQRTDEMPFDVVEIGQRLLFFQRFLQIVLAEGALTGHIGLTQHVRRFGFADSKQAGGVVRAIGRGQRCSKTLAGA